MVLHMPIIIFLSCIILRTNRLSQRRVAMFAICCIISLFIVAVGLVLSLLLVGESIYALVKRIERAGTMLMFGLI